MNPLKKTIALRFSTAPRITGNCPTGYT